MSAARTRFREGDDETPNEDGGATITDVTANNLDNDEGGKHNYADDKLDVQRVLEDIDACLGDESLDDESLEETKRKRTEEFVNSASEIINHSASLTWYREPRSPSSSENDDALSVVTQTSCSSIVDNSQVPCPEVISLDRAVRSSGLAEAPGDPPATTIALTAFQEELLPEVRNKENVAIFLPTGTGKTYLVLKYVQELLSQPNSASVRVVFLAPKVKLAEQQCLRFQQFFPECTYLRTGRSRSNRAPFSELLKLKYQVFVMTPRCLVCAVEEGEVKLTDFSLLVLDECHHAVGRHDYKILMDLFMDTKFSCTRASPMPQVVGLTASPGAGKGSSVAEAQAHITQLCYNMDVGRIATVERNVSELEQFVAKPRHDIHKCSPRKKDGFKRIIEGMMKTIEEDMAQCLYVARQTERERREELRTAFTAPSLYRGAPRYSQWVNSLTKQLDALVYDNTEAYRLLFSSLEMLDLYQKSLLLNENCESAYVLEYLQTEVKKLQDAEPMNNSVDSWLLRHFQGHLQKLEIACRDGEDFNPRLRMLEDILLAMKEKHQEDCSCMVFVRTIHLTQTIQRWIQDHPDLKTLQPGRIIGNRRGGMTIGEASDVLDKFSKGIHKIVICTSAAEEGLDIPSCSVVIRYDLHASMIAMIQTRGRARHRDSQYVVLGSQKADTADREKGNLAAERLMNQAVAQLKKDMSDNPADFGRHMQQSQTAACQARKDAAERTSRKRRLQEESDTPYRLLCRKCQTMACLSTDLRLLGNSNRLVIADSFQTRWKKVEKKGKLAEEFQPSLEKIAKVHCKECSFDWGCLIRYKVTGVEYPLLKFASFFFEDPRTGKKVMGKDAPFTIEKITYEELSNLSA